MNKNSSATKTVLRFFVPLEFVDFVYFFGYLLFSLRKEGGGMYAKKRSRQLSETFNHC